MSKRVFSSLSCTGPRYLKAKRGGKRGGVTPVLPQSHRDGTTDVVLYPVPTPPGRARDTETTFLKNPT